MGVMGLMGAPGKDAPPAAAAGYRPRFWGSCSVSLDLLSLPAGAGRPIRAADGAGESGLDYTFMLYTNADVEVQCGATIGSAQAGSAGKYYPAITVGSQDGTCLASVDYPETPEVVPGTVGLWRFKLVKGSGPRATYEDPDDPLGLNGFTQPFTDNDCNAYTLEQSGQWQDVSLSVVFAP
jgi:hypothetical protein